MLALMCTAGQVRQLCKKVRLCGGDELFSELTQVASLARRSPSVWLKGLARVSKSIRLPAQWRQSGA